MSQSFNISAPTARSSLEALLGGASNANQAEDGLFSSLLTLMGGTNGPKVSDLVQIGTPKNTGQAWLNLQYGDASLSLSSQSLTTAMSPETMFSMVPGIMDDLNLDDLALQGLNNLGQSINQAIQNPAASTQSQTAGTLMNNAVLGLQEAAQNVGAQIQSSLNSTNSLQQGTADTTSQLTNANQAASNAAATLAKSLSGQNQSAGTPLTLEQIATRDSLAAQLQQQLTTSAEQQQLRVAAATRQNTSPNAQTTTQAAAASAQGPAGFNATLTQLPFVQTRQVATLNEQTLPPQHIALATTKANPSALFQPVKAAYQSPQVNLPHMAITIARNFSAGNNNFQIRLDPAELGRLNIQLSVDEAGKVHAKMLVERPETLQLLQQDTRALERALTQAGLEGARATLEFIQKDNPFSGNGFANPNDRQNPEQNGNDKPENPDNGADTAIAAYQGAISPGGVSLWV